MKAAVYSPYLDTFGGGERYMATIAESLSSRFEVDVLLDLHILSFGKDKLKTVLENRFNLNLAGINFIQAPVGIGTSPLERLFFLKKYKILFYLTDGSIFFPSAEKNILHIQSPLIGQPSYSFWGRLKLKSWKKIIYNSKFTKINSEKNWPLESLVVYPPADTRAIKPLQKRKYILSVGRFFGYLKDKKHKILIDVFKDLYQRNNLTGWSLHLAGSAGEGDLDYLNELERMSKGFPVQFYPNLDYKELIRLYGESSVYWHAAGFGEDDPVKMEHFGIATVEAMAGGCVPLVVNKGGQQEIVENDKNGFLWDSLQDLERFTLLLVKDQHLRTRLSQNAVVTSKKFSKEKFQKEIIKLVQD